MELPFVSRIMPTNSNREVFIPYAIDYFLHQDYSNAELLILDDGSKPFYSITRQHKRIQYHYSALSYTLGEMRNIPDYKN